jgi:hypothetical protein
LRFRSFAAAAALVAVAAAGCTANSSQDPSGLADSITRAVYANDYDGTTASMDSETKAEVTRGEIGQLSDRMHALGAYQGLSQTKADADHGMYDFDLRFARGRMTARLRVDPSGKVGAYRVFPETGPNPMPSTTTTGSNASVRRYT